MKTADQYRFKNLASQRFHDFFVKKISTGEISKDHFYRHYGLKPGSNNYLLYSLRNAKASITIDQIEIAKEKYGLNPAHLFDVSPQEELPTNTLNEAEPTYASRDADIKKHIGTVLGNIFKRHRTKVTEYAQARLGMTPQALNKIMRGDQRMFLEDAVTVCEDHNETLDQFRRVPIAGGQYHARIKFLEDTVLQLRQQLKEK